MSLVLAGRLSATWTVLAGLVTLGVIVAGVFQILQLYIVEILQRKMFVRSAFEFAYRIPHFKLKGLGSSYAPEIVHRFFDVVGVQKNLNKVLLDFASSALQIVFGLILLSLYHPVFIAFGLVLLIILILIIVFTSKKGLSTSLAESNSKYKLAYWLTELARSLPTFKLNGSDHIALAKTDEITKEYLSNRKRHFRIVVSQLVSILSLKTFVTAGLLIIGAILLINNSITIGQFVASEIVIILVLNSSEKLIASMESMYDLLTSVEKLGKVTDLPLDELNEDRMLVDRTKALKLEVVELTVHGILNQKPILSKLNFKVEPQERLCIVGESGSGKSTLLKTLSSMLDTYEGTINVNDIPLSNYNINSYRQSIKVVLSEQEIFNASVIDNIGMQDPSVSTEEIIKVIDKVGLSHLGEKLPNGYYTLLSNAERMLSKTDRIRLVTARAIIGQPTLILAEDVFSDLDKKVGEELIDILMRECKGSTLIMTSNQPYIIDRFTKTVNLNAHVKH